MRMLLLLMLAAACAAQDQMLSLDHWRVHDGDNAAWSQPEFDDSAWAASSSPAIAARNNTYHGVRWYRTSVALPSKLRGAELALGFGWLDECYEVFVEGRLAGRFGRWDKSCSSPTPRNRVFPIPADHAERDQFHIAVRRWLDGPGAAWLAVRASERPSRSAPVLGQRSVVQTAEELHTLDGQLQSIPWNITYLLALIAGVISIAFYSAQKTQIEYLLLGLYCLCFSSPLLAIPILSKESVGERSPVAVATLALFVIPFSLAVLILSYLCPRYRLVLWIAAGISFIGSMGGPWTLATGSVAAMRIYAFQTRILPLPYLIALWGMRRDRGVGAKLVAATLSLFSLTDGYGQRLPFSHIPVGQFALDLRSIGLLLSIFTMMIVLYRRFRENQLRQALVDEDLAAARRIQEMLLAPGTGGNTGFAVEAVHRPAREVGGDFHQEIAGPDGSLLVVVGDVSGKGLPAAMLVSTVVGALGDLSSRRPSEVLSHLNRALAGRTSGGFVTCCCALVGPDGGAILANAGHIPPFLDDVSLELDNGLPLGIDPDAKYLESPCMVGVQRLTFISDGVIEAAGANGELLGFERTREISTRPANEIAAAAQAWGQTDDITVVTVRRSA
ncbi:MAG TPA: PP2C family protein-serine/threonine phosphatase [Verrucomicrobiae bacterium]|nr:PP2C family protein-serine/threonine phosphatase [Verrucomicrobiae bacterium]